MLAIDGGPPSVDSEPFQWPFASEAIRNAVSEAMSDGSWGQYDGRWTRQLIELLKHNFQTAEAMLCSQRHDRSRVSTSRCWCATGFRGNSGWI